MATRQPGLTEPCGRGRPGAQSFSWSSSFNPHHDSVTSTLSLALFTDDEMQRVKTHSLLRMNERMNEMLRTPPFSRALGNKPQS